MHSILSLCEIGVKTILARQTTYFGDENDKIILFNQKIVI
jgi:hypothetical protein